MTPPLATLLTLTCKKDNAQLGRMEKKNVDFATGSTPGSKNIKSFRKI